MNNTICFDNRRGPYRTRLHSRYVIHKMIDSLFAIGDVPPKWHALTQSQVQKLVVYWQQKNINIVGIIATLPEKTERGVRFQFDVEKVLTKAADLKVPKHIALTFYPKISVNSGLPSHF